MTGDMFLIEFRKRRSCVDDMADKLREMQSIATSTYEKFGMRTDRSRTPNRRVENYAILSVQYNEAVISLIQDQTKATLMIAEIADNLTATVLMRHFLLGETFDMIADRLKYSRQQIMRINKKGLAEMAKITVDDKTVL